MGLGTMTRRAWLLAAIALLALGAVACSGDDDDDDDDGGAEATSTATVEDGDDGDDAADGETMEITVVFQDNFFEPDTITIPAGTTVTFKYENQGAAVHNMIVQAKDVEGEDFSSEVSRESRATPASSPGPSPRPARSSSSAPSTSPTWSGRSLSSSRSVRRTRIVMRGASATLALLVALTLLACGSNEESDDWSINALFAPDAPAEPLLVASRVGVGPGAPRLRATRARTVP